MQRDINIERQHASHHSSVHLFTRTDAILEHDDREFKRRARTADIDFIGFDVLVEPPIEAQEDQKHPV